MVDAIVVEIGLPAAAPCRDALRKHSKDGIEVAALELPVGVGASNCVEQFVFTPFL
jgi:hypothetical protein